MEGHNGLGSNTKGHNIFQTPRDTQSNLLAFDGGDAYFMQNIKIIYGRLNGLSRLKYSTFCTSPPPQELVKEMVDADMELMKNNPNA